MLFESIHFRNFLSFGPESQPVKLGPLNVLVGPNGSGKSNFIEGIAFLRGHVSGKSQPPYIGGAISDIPWKGAEKTRSDICFGVNNFGVMEYSIGFCSDLTSISFEKDEIIDMSGEKYIRKNMTKAGGGFVKHDESDGAKKVEKNPSDSHHVYAYPSIDFAFLFDIVPSIRMYRDWVSGRYNPTRQPQPSDGPADVLEEDCSNLGMVLSQIKEDRKLRTAFIEHVRDLYPTIIDFDVRILPGFVQVTLEEEHIGRIPATRLSDGTLRYLCLLAILLNPTPPPLVCIEEPELGLHPDVQNRLARLMRDASERMQIIVTTHSEAFVDALTDTPEALMVCERHNGSTVIERVDPERFAVWLQDHSLGDLWRGGYIGGNRW